MQEDDKMLKGLLTRSIRAARAFIAAGFASIALFNVTFSISLSNCDISYLILVIKMSIGPLTYYISVQAYAFLNYFIVYISVHSSFFPRVNEGVTD